MTRDPVVAGQFYPASAKELRTQIESFVDKGVNSQRVIGLISPHAGYVYSGAVAGAVFSRTVVTDTVVILGPNHSGLGPAVSLYKQGKWRTPLGELDIDAKLADRITKSSMIIKADSNAHAYEHSLEVQLPIMQYFKKDFKIVPIVLVASGHDTYQEIAYAIASSIKESRKSVLIVASSDMTHYEPQRRAEEKDKMAIDAVLDLDENLLLDRIQKFSITMCGFVPAAVMLITAKLLGAKTAELIKYQTSGDTSGDYNAVVGYAGIIVY